MTFLFQIVIGSLRNVSLYYIFLKFSGYCSRYTDMNFSHLAVAHSLVIYSRGIIETMTAFGWTYFLNDMETSFLYPQTGQGYASGIPYTLSMSWAIMIITCNSRWAKLKINPPKYISPSNKLCWVLQMVINFIINKYVCDQLIEQQTKHKKYRFVILLNYLMKKSQIYSMEYCYPCMKFSVWEP